MPDDKSKLKDWTIMIYLAGDNNLSENMAETLYNIKNNIQQVARDAISNINILVYYDSSVQNIPPRYYDLNKTCYIPVSESKVYNK